MTDSRRSVRFSWHTVDDTVIRRLLKTAYEEIGPDAEARKVASLSPDQLRRQAERVLGRPPKSRLRLALTDALRESWLPRATAEQLANLTYVVNRYNALSTRQEMVEFLRTRNRTEGFVTNLWSAFITAHKELSTNARTAGGAAPRARASVAALVGEDGTPRHQPYAHQESAWLELDRLRAAGGRRSGLLVIPTGGGKTATMVT